MAAVGAGSVSELQKFLESEFGDAGLKVFQFVSKLGGGTKKEDLKELLLSDDTQWTHIESLLGKLPTRRLRKLLGMGEDLKTFFGRFDSKRADTLAKMAEEKFGAHTSEDLKLLEPKDQEELEKVMGKLPARRLLKELGVMAAAPAPAPAPAPTSESGSGSGSGGASLTIGSMGSFGTVVTGAPTNAQLKTVVDAHSKTVETVKDRPSENAEIASSLGALLKNGNKIAVGSAGLAGLTVDISPKLSVESRANGTAFKLIPSGAEAAKDTQWRFATTVKVAKPSGSQNETQTEYRESTHESEIFIPHEEKVEKISAESFDAKTGQSQTVEYAGDLTKSGVLAGVTKGNDSEPPPLSTATAHVVDSDRRAVFMGVSEYYRSAGTEIWPPLPGCDADAKFWQSLLADSKFIKTAPNQILLNVSKENVEKEIVPYLQAGSSVFAMFSGHGFCDKNKSAGFQFVGGDSKGMGRDNFIGRVMAGGGGDAKTKPKFGVFIFDCCSSKVDTTKQSAEPNDFKPLNFPICVITATAMYGKAIASKTGGTGELVKAYEEALKQPGGKSLFAVHRRAAAIAAKKNIGITIQFVSSDPTIDIYRLFPFGLPAAPTAAATTAVPIGAAPATTALTPAAPTTGTASAVSNPGATATTNYAGVSLTLGGGANVKIGAWGDNVTTHQFNTGSATGSGK